MAQVEHVWRVLNLKGNASPMRMLDEIGRGLPIQTLEKLSQKMAPHDASFKYRVVPKSTFHRLAGVKQFKGGGAKVKSRKTRSRPAIMNSQQSEQVARLARVWAAALDVWVNEDNARRFLNEPHVLLEGRTALDVTLAGDIGATLVEDILGRLKYGTAV